MKKLFFWGFVLFCLVILWLFMLGLVVSRMWSFWMLKSYKISNWSFSMTFCLYWYHFCSTSSSYFLHRHQCRGEATWAWRWLYFFCTSIPQEEVSDISNSMSHSLSLFKITCWRIFFRTYLVFKAWYSVVTNRLLVSRFNSSFFNQTQEIFVVMDLFFSFQTVHETAYHACF